MSPSIDQIETDASSDSPLDDLPLDDSPFDIQWQIEERKDCPEDAQIRAWAKAALPEGDESGVTIRIVDAAEIQASNQQWRGKDKPTNVLSFAADFPIEAQVPYWGDILICAEVLKRESLEQNKALADHWAHIVIHGLLHLQGFDHENEQEASVMEQREREILTTLGVADPYSGEREQVDS